MEPHRLSFIRLRDNRPGSLKGTLYRSYKGDGEEVEKECERPRPRR